MSRPHSEESWPERGLAVLVLAVFWTAFICLGAGLALVQTMTDGPPGTELLATGLYGLLILPIVRLAAALLSATRTRDWITVGATLAVLAILFALTLRDAAMLG